MDIFQKIKAVGFNTVSFYADWALLEGKQGDFSAEGVFAFEPFFDAAKQAGIYLIAVREFHSKLHHMVRLILNRDRAVCSYKTLLGTSFRHIDHATAYINAETSGGGK